MEEYPNNSHKARNGIADTNPEEKVVEKVISGTVKTAKKGLVKRVLGWFLNDDIDNLGSYLIRNILLPAFRRAVSDSVDVAMNGESGRRKKSGLSEYRGGYSSDDRPRYNVRDPYEIEDIILDSYGDCEIVLDELGSMIREYGMASVSDLNALIGKSGNAYTDYKYGWNSIKTARIIPVRNGFRLKLPRVIPLDI